MTDPGRVPANPTLLGGAAVLYGAIVRLRNTLYDRKVIPSVKLSRPVVSVGNLTAGGTGKTPMVIHLARFLRERGYRPAVVSRGYGSRGGQAVNVVSDGRAVLLDPERAGDEPYLMARVLGDVPVVTGPKRVDAGRAAIRLFRPDLLLLDDGFQHRRLRRDLDIVLLDEDLPFGNGHLLPRGRLREPLRGLSRADLIVLTGPGTGDPAPPEDPRIPRDRPLFHAVRKAEGFLRGRDNRSYPLEHLEGKPLYVFSGIGNPASFHSLLSAIPGTALSLGTFPDHHRYTGGDVERIREEAARIPGAAIVTTEKDAVRLEKYPDFFEDLYRLRISMALGAGKGDFESMVLEKLSP
jgi:tetraacyldisaccharide 4'-kinase